MRSKRRRLEKKRKNQTGIVFFLITHMQSPSRKTIPPPRRSRTPSVPSRRVRRRTTVNFTSFDGNDTSRVPLHLHQFRRRRRRRRRRSRRKSPSPHQPGAATYHHPRHRRRQSPRASPPVPPRAPPRLRQRRLQHPRNHRLQHPRNHRKRNHDWKWRGRR